MRDRAIVIIVICLVISHKVTPLNSSSLAFLWSVALCITMAQWKQWQRQAATDIFSKAIHNSLTLFDESLTPGCWNSLVISEIYWGLLLGILGSHQLKFSPLDFFCKPSVLMTLIPNALAQWFFWLGAISTGSNEKVKNLIPELAQTLRVTICDCLLRLFETLFLMMTVMRIFDLKLTLVTNIDNDAEHVIDI